MTAPVPVPEQQELEGQELQLEEELQREVEQELQHEVEKELQKGTNTTKPGGEECYTPVCSLSELQELGRRRVTCDERAVVVFHVKETGNVYALDHFCYRESAEKTASCFNSLFFQILVVHLT